MGVPFAERISVAKVRRLVEKAERDMFLAGFWSLWPNCCRHRVSQSVLHGFFLKEGNAVTGWLGWD